MTPSRYHVEGAASESAANGSFDRAAFTVCLAGNRWWRSNSAAFPSVPGERGKTCSWLIPEPPLYTSWLGSHDGWQSNATR